jgi:phosphatidate cytidylyltransferase
MSVVVLFAALEWARLLGFSNGIQKTLWLLVFGVLLLLCWIFWSLFLLPIIVAGVVWWLFVILRLSTCPAEPEPVWARMLAAFVTLVPAWAALVYLHQTDLRLLVAVFLVVWLADTGAYFCGRSFGKRKLAPLISPGKTIEGLLGGIVSVVVLAAATAGWTGAGSTCILAWIGICIAAALVSVAGDLWESKMKRIAGVKDSGTLLPGHGGVLDRIDSITAAAPVFVSGLYLINNWASLCEPVIGHVQ